MHIKKRPYAGQVTSDDLVSVDFEGSIIPFNRRNGFINAAAMGEAFGIGTAFGSAPRQFLRLVSTKDVIAEIANDLKVAPEILVIKDRGWGAWFHPDLALDYAIWISPYCAKWYLDLLHGLLLSGLDDNTSIKQVAFSKLLSAVRESAKENKVRKSTIDWYRDRYWALKFSVPGKIQSGILDLKGWIGRAIEHAKSSIRRVLRSLKLRLRSSR